MSSKVWNIAENISYSHAKRKGWRGGRTLIREIFVPTAREIVVAVIIFRGRIEVWMGAEANPGSLSNHKA